MYNVVENPIPKSGMFAMPADMEHLTSILNNIGTKEEQRLAWCGAMMAFNLAHKLVEDEILSKDIFAS